MISDKVELEGMINWTKGSYDPDISYFSDEDYTDTTVSLGGRYHWLPSVSTGATVTSTAVTARVPSAAATPSCWTCATASVPTSPSNTGTCVTAIAPPRAGRFFSGSCNR